MGGFFDGKEYDYTSAGDFVGEKEKLELFSQGTALLVKGVRLNSPSQFGDQDLLTVDIGGEDRALPFKSDSVPTRHEMLKDLQAYIDAGSPDGGVYVKLAREGRAWILLDAS